MSVGIRFIRVIGWRVGLTVRIYYAEIATWTKSSIQPVIINGSATPTSIKIYKSASSVSGGQYFVLYQNVMYIFASSELAKVGINYCVDYIGAGTFWDRFKTQTRGKWIATNSLASDSIKVVWSDLTKYAGMTPATYVPVVEPKPETSLDDSSLAYGSVLPLDADLEDDSSDIYSYKPVDVDSTGYQSGTSSYAEQTLRLTSTDINAVASALASTQRATFTEIKAMMNSLNTNFNQFAFMMGQPNQYQSLDYIREKQDVLDLKSQQILDELNRIKEEERATYELTDKMRDIANDIYILQQQEVTRQGDVYDANSDLSVAVEGIKTNLDYLREIQDNPNDELFTGVLDEGFMTMRDINLKLDVLADAINNSVIPNLVRGTAMTIPNLSQPIDSEKFNQQIDTLQQVVNLVEMATAGYLAAKVAFDPEEGSISQTNLPSNYYNMSEYERQIYWQTVAGIDPVSGLSNANYVSLYSFIPDFNMALTQFRSLINMVNTLSKNVGYYGPYSGGGSVWEYSATPRNGFLKSRFGDYYVRKRLG